MDSLTQITLGASVAGAVGIKPFGRRVLIAGAILGTLPDLDILLSYPTAIENFTYHRGFSHSIFTLTTLSIFIFLLSLWIKPKFGQHKKALFLTIFLPLLTHPLLDSFTSYGTQLWWPIPLQPTSWSSIFIIDPLYTIPLLIAVIGLWMHSHTSKWKKLNRIALLFSCFYLCLGQAQVWYLKEKLAQDPIVQGNQLFISPTPFNTYVWRVISYQKDTYYEAFINVFNQQPLEWKPSTTGRALLGDFNSAELERLEWFSGGILAFEESDEALVVTDLRIGLSTYYPFSFRIAKKEDQWISIASEKLPQPKVDMDILMQAIR